MRTLKDMFEALEANARMAQVEADAALAKAKDSRAAALEFEPNGSPDRSEPGRTPLLRREEGNRRVAPLPTCP